MSEIRNVYRVVGGVIGSMATGNTGANNASHIPGSPISGEHIYALSKMSDKIKELSYSISNYSSGKPFPLEKYGVFLVGYDDKAGVFEVKIGLHNTPYKVSKQMLYQEFRHTWKTMNADIKKRRKIAEKRLRAQINQTKEEIKEVISGSDDKSEKSPTFTKAQRAIVNKKMEISSKINQEYTSKEELDKSKQEIAELYADIRELEQKAKKTNEINLGAKKQTKPSRHKMIEGAKEEIKNLGGASVKKTPKKGPSEDNKGDDNESSLSL